MAAPVPVRSPPRAWRPCPAKPQPRRHPSRLLLLLLHLSWHTFVASSSSFREKPEILAAAAGDVAAPTYPANEESSVLRLPQACRPLNRRRPHQICCAFRFPPASLFHPLPPPSAAATLPTDSPPFQTRHRWWTASPTPRLPLLRHSRRCCRRLRHLRYHLLSLPPKRATKKMPIPAGSLPPRPDVPAATASIVVVGT